MKEPAITDAIIAKHGITPEEYARIRGILGRDPNFTELGIFSVMWSEHCSYKNSRPELKKFPVTGERILVKAGEENAGVLDVGDGWAVAFKIESHNHPSAIEPFQGAAPAWAAELRAMECPLAGGKADIEALYRGAGDAGEAVGGGEEDGEDGGGAAVASSRGSGGLAADVAKRIRWRRCI